MENTFERLVQDGEALQSSIREWDSVRRKAMWYVSQKEAHRFDGKDSSFVFDLMKPATWDMLRDMETTP